MVDMICFKSDVDHIITLKPRVEDTLALNLTPAAMRSGQRDIGLGMGYLS
jgi:hypothetical protein